MNVLFISPVFHCQQTNIHNSLLQSLLIFTVLHIKLSFFTIIMYYTLSALSV